MQALIQGDFNYFKAIENPYIFPIFNASDRIRLTPLLSLRILILLRQARQKNQPAEDKHIGVTDIVSYFDGIGVSESGTKFMLDRLLGADLIEPYDLSDREIHNSQRIAVTNKGMAHIDLAFFNDAFFAQMLFTTSINDPEIIEKIRFISSKGSLGRDSWYELFTIFSKYLIREDELTCSVPNNERYRAQVEMLEEFSARWVNRPSKKPIQKPNPKLEEATVEWFDRAKGFGFVRIESLRENAFLHISVIERFGISNIKDGESLKCSLTTNARGLAVEQIFKVGDGDTRNNTPHNGVVIRLVDDKGFGFVSSVSLEEDAFFHVTLFDDEQRKRLKEGSKLKFLVAAGRDGRSYQVSKIYEIT